MYNLYLQRNGLKSSVSESSFDYFKRKGKRKRLVASVRYQLMPDTILSLVYDFTLKYMSDVDFDKEEIIISFYKDKELVTKFDLNELLERTK